MYYVVNTTGQIEGPYPPEWIRAHVTPSTLVSHGEQWVRYGAHPDFRTSNAGGPLYIGVGGHVVAIDRATGAEIWRCQLGSSSFITIAVEPDAIYAGVDGELFCVDPATGSIRWHNRLSGLGTSVIAFAGSESTAIAAARHAAQTAATIAATNDLAFSPMKITTD